MALEERSFVRQCTLHSFQEAKTMTLSRPRPQATNTRSRKLKEISGGGNGGMDEGMEVEEKKEKGWG